MLCNKKSPAPSRHAQNPDQQIVLCVTTEKRVMSDLRATYVSGDAPCMGDRHSSAFRTPHFLEQCTDCSCVVAAYLEPDSPEEPEPSGFGCHRSEPSLWGCLPSPHGSPCRCSIHTRVRPALLVPMKTAYERE